MAKREISNSDDVIDSRDVIARIDEIKAEREALMEKPFGYQSAAHADLESELAALLKLEEQAEPYAADWRYGETLIRDDYFEAYARELADDCGMVPKDLKWPFTCIDWEQAARELQQDYTSVDFDCVTYWVRG